MLYGKLRPQAVLLYDMLLEQTRSGITYISEEDLAKALDSTPRMVQEYTRELVRSGLACRLSQEDEEKTLAVAGGTIIMTQESIDNLNEAIEKVADSVLPETRLKLGNKKRRLMCIGKSDLPINLRTAKGYSAWKKWVLYRYSQKDRYKTIAEQLRDVNRFFDFTEEGFVKLITKSINKKLNKLERRND